MERLVGDLLASSAIESGVLRLRRDWTDLELVLRAARDCLTHRDRVTVSVAAGLEPIWADHDRLEQVFVNLLENGIRHGKPGGAVRVTATPAAGGSEVEILVSDDGGGVPPEVARKIFEPRVRGDGSTGAGLGLSIVRGIAETHGGRCELLPGAPTTFRVVLPVEPAEQERQERQERQAHEHGPHTADVPG
jgi:signal transduction histidine kinase